MTWDLGLCLVIWGRFKEVGHCSGLDGWQEGVIILTRHLDSYLQHKKNEMMRTLMGRDVRVTYISQDRKRLSGCFCDLGNVHIFFLCSDMTMVALFLLIHHGHNGLG